MATSQVVALERELGISFALAQVLARRGLKDWSAARDFLEAGTVHDPSEFAGIDGAVALILAHVEAGSRITIHGDYDVDGVASTAILVRALRALGADVDWYLPSRTEDGYGLSPATVERLAERGTKLLVTADCGITAVAEVALARELGLDVVVTDHHTPLADGRLPAAPIVHPAVCGYPCEALCAAGVAYKLAEALRCAAGAAPAEDDLDLVALATVADCVPLQGENRRLVRAGLQALSRTAKPGLRALMQIAKVDPSRVDATSIGFRLAPRINAAGRLHRADAGLELLLTEDPQRAAAIAQELDDANAERRHVETRILFAAEAQVAEQGEQPAYVLAGDDWHPGVIGIVASRIAERHHRPTVLVAFDGQQGTGSGRSIPAFDLLGGLNAAAGHLIRHGGHRAAAGCAIDRASLEAFRSAFAAHVAGVLRPEDLVPVQRVDAVVSGDELGVPLAEELARLAPFGTANPSVSLLVPAARLVDPRPMGEGKHLRFTVESGGVRARAVAFGHSKLPEGADGPLDATFTLELNEFNGAVEPRLVLREAAPPAAAPARLVGEPEPGSAAWLAGLTAAPVSPARPAEGPARLLRDRRGSGVAGTIAALTHSGESVLVVCSDAIARRRHLAGRLGGFDLTSWDALEQDPSLAAAYRHVVALDPPPSESLPEAVGAGLASAASAPEEAGMAWLAYGDPELRFARGILDRDLLLRPGLVELYRRLRAGADVASALGEWPLAPARRLVTVLREIGLLDEQLAVRDGVARADLERSAAFVAARDRHRECVRWLSSATERRAA